MLFHTDRAHRFGLGKSAKRLQFPTQVNAVQMCFILGITSSRRKRRAKLVTKSHVLDQFMQALQKHKKLSFHHGCRSGFRVWAVENVSPLQRWSISCYRLWTSFNNFTHILVCFAGIGILCPQVSET